MFSFVSHWNNSPEYIEGVFCRRFWAFCFTTHVFGGTISFSLKLLRYRHNSFWMQMQESKMKMWINTGIILLPKGEAICLWEKKFRLSLPFGTFRAYFFIVYSKVQAFGELRYQNLWHTSSAHRLLWNGNSWKTAVWSSS